MIQITPQMRLLLAVEPVDFQKGIDGLAGLCRKVLREDPFSGYLFVFRNRSATAVKILVYDGQGFWLCQKRLSKGKFKWWPNKGGDCARQLDAHELHKTIISDRFKRSWNGRSFYVGKRHRVFGFPYRFSISGILNSRSIRFDFQGRDNYYGANDEQKTEERREPNNGHID